MYFHRDQIEALRRPSTRFRKWSNTTVTKALRLRFACGTTGYEELIKHHMPLPSLRTLRRRLENVHFEPGILHEVFEFLSIKVGNFKDTHERDCVITVDEMAITPAKIYDPALKVYLGNVNLAGHSSEKVANHALVIMLGGITRRWKQTVAYYFTGSSVDGRVYKDILYEIISKTEKLGLSVVAIISDMGAANQAFWKLCGVTAGRHARIKNYIQHPTDTNKKIYILADVPHLFKNIKNMLVTNRTIDITIDMQIRFNLPTRVVDIQHVEDVIKYQKPLQFKLAPKLTEEDLTPTHFNKMRVKKSTNVVSHDVSSALKFLCEELHKPQYKSTAWFLDLVEQWFVLMTSRHPTLALSKHNMEAYQNALSHLRNVIDVFGVMEVGEKRAWKPSQTGLLISTQSILDIQEDFFTNRNYAFILTSRFTQDCLENLFSVIRAKQAVPNALQFKNHLKLISVGQYLKEVSRSSYDHDDREFLAEFLNIEHANVIYSPAVIPEDFVPPVITLGNAELNSLYNICGYILKSIRRNAKICSRCMEAAGSKTFIHFRYAQLVRLKCFKQNTLYFCNESTFHLCVKMETIFRQYFNTVTNQKNVNLKDFFVNKISEGCKSFKHLPDCHNLKTKLIRRFVVFRLKIASRKCKKQKQNMYASKSVMAVQL